MVGELLHSLPAALGKLTCAVVVVDNGSHDGTADLLVARGDCHVVRSTNLAYAAGINHGATLAPPGADLLVLNRHVRMAGALPLLAQGRVRVALFLDGTRVREAIEDAFTSGALAAYALAIFDGGQARLVDVPTVAALQRPRPSPMNHYVVLHRRE